MPQIPEYQHQVLPTGQAPSAIAPPNIGSAPWQALGQAGQEISSIGDAWNKKITEAKQGAEYGSAVAQLHVGLSDLYGKVTTDPTYLLDPDAGKKAYDDESKKFIADQLSQIKDPHVKQLVEKQSQGLWASHTVSVNDWNRKRHIDMIGGTHLQNIDLNTRLAINAENDANFDVGYNGVVAAIEGMHKSGVINDEKYAQMIREAPKKVLLQRAEAEIARSPDGFISRLDNPQGIFARLDDADKGRLRHQAAGLSRTQITQAREDQERILKEQDRYIVAGVAKHLTDLYKVTDPEANNMEAASEYLNNPDNWAALGFRDSILGPAADQAKRVQDLLLEARNHAVQMRNENQAKAGRSFMQAKDDREVAGKPMTYEEAAKWKDPKTGLRPPQEMLDNVAKATVTNRSHASFQALDDKIRQYPFRMKDTSEIDMARSNGEITLAERKDLIKAFEIYHDPDKSPVLQDAKEAFWARYGDGKPIAPAKLNEELKRHPEFNVFIKQFENMVDRQSLSPHQYREQADLMLKDLDKKVIKSWGPGWTTGTAKTYYDQWGVFPEPELIQHVPPETQETPVRGVPVAPADVPGKKITRPVPAKGEGQPAEPGNIDYNTLPWVDNPDGSHSSVRSQSFNIDGKEVLLPMISADGKQMTDKQAVARYKATGLHLGKFDTPEEASAYAEKHHAGMAPDPKIRHIPREQREWYVGILKKNGKAVTPEAILFLHSQYTGKDE